MRYRKKIKLIALDWRWFTLISWCQMNRLGHSSSVMHNVEGKTHKHLEELKIMSRKYILFWHFLMKYFQITWVDIHIFLNKNDNTPILQTCLTLCWSCLCSIVGYLVDPLWFWVLRVKNQKTLPSSWVGRNLIFFLIGFFSTFVTVMTFWKCYWTHKFCVDSRYEIISFWCSR